MENKGIVCFGEIMLRLAPYHFERIAQAQTFQAGYGGGEANVAVSLAHFGQDSCFVSAIPDNPVGQAAVNTLRRYGVDIRHIRRSGERLGIYFLEHGASIRPSTVTYDRSGSSISQAGPGDFDWDEILDGKAWFHTSGITPALSASAAALTLEAVKAAKAHGLMVSVDLNYRRKLWSREEAGKSMREIVQYTDLIIANEEDCADVFGIHAGNTDIEAGKLDAEKYAEVARQVMEISSAKAVAITLRESLSASDNNWSALLWDGRRAHLSRSYAIHLIDRVGGGDSFGAALIHGMLAGMGAGESLEFAVAASALKQTLPGDMNLVSEAEVMQVVKGNTSGRVQR